MTNMGSPVDQLRRIMGKKRFWQDASTVFVLFVGVLVVLYSLATNSQWGIFTAFLSSCLFCLTIHLPLAELLINICANTIQAMLLWLVLQKINTSGLFFSNEPIISPFNCILFFVGILYFILSAVFSDIYTVIIFAATISAIIGLHAMISKTWGFLTFLLMVCLMPSLAGAVINSSYMLFYSGKTDGIIESISTWTFSNFVLYSIFGYFIIRFVPNLINKKIKAVGNIFFVSNLFMSRKKEISNCEDPFEWFEKRAIVAENNTQMLIAVISFLLPISAEYLGTINKNLAIVFMMNITAAIVSIGLIWVPQNEVHTIEIMKNIKTISHLFTLSFLLLALFMIINN